MTSSDSVLASIQFLNWLAKNNLDWGTAPVVVPQEARVAGDTSTGTQYVLAHGILTGTANHGDVVVFARPFIGIPVVIFGDGGLSYSSVIGAAASQQRQLVGEAQPHPAVGRGLAELVRHGRYVTLDLSPLGLERLRDGRPLIEQAVV